MKNIFKESSGFYLQTSKIKISSSVPFIKFITLLKSYKYLTKHKSLL